MTDYSAARLHMVDSQLRTNRVIDPAVLQAFLSVPRERFVPAELSGIAYVDEDIHIGGGRYLMEPMVLARLLQAAAIAPDDRVLDVGCSTGYSAALLAGIARTVTAVEEDAGLAARARAALGKVAAGSVTLGEGGLADGWPPGAPYDVILIDGAVAEVPPALAEQLAPGGRLVTVLKAPHRIGKAVLMERVAGTLSRRELFDAAVPLLPGFVPEPSFQF